MYNCRCRDFNPQPTIFKFKKQFSNPVLFRTPGCPSSSNLRDLEVGNYSLHSPRPFLWLFRHSTRQGRRCIPPRASKVHEAVKRLRQSSQPLVIDLGCGFGASSLGLAQGGHAVLAVDASAHCIRYATALSRRWQLPQSQVSFVQCAAEDALAAVRSVEMAAVKWILINFPTPFAAPQNDGAWLSCLKTEHRLKNQALPRSVMLCPRWVVNTRFH